MKRYMILTRDGSDMLMSMDCEPKEFQAKLLDFVGAGFKYELITEAIYLQIKALWRSN